MFYNFIFQRHDANCIQVNEPLIFVSKMPIFTYILWRFNFHL